MYNTIFASFYFLIEVYKIPHLIDTQSEIKSNTALLHWTFTASCGDNLTDLHWNKDGHYVGWDKRFSPHIYCRDGKTKTIYKLEIKNITRSDSGNYTCYLQYNQLVHSNVMAAGSIHLNVSGMHTLCFIHDTYN